MRAQYEGIETLERALADHVEALFMGYSNEVKAEACAMVATAYLMELEENHLRTIGDQDGLQVDLIVSKSEMTQ